MCLHSHTLTIQVVEYLKAVLTEHDFACFTCAPVMDGLIDQVFATFSAVTSYACFVRHDVFTGHHYEASYLTYHHVHDQSQRFRKESPYHYLAENKNNDR